MELYFKAKANSRQEAYNSIKNQLTGYLRRKGMANRYAEIQSTEWKQTELFGGGEMKARVWVKDSKMSEYNKFIDSVVGNIARKIEDEFNENDHPRDKGGRFTSAGKESRKASGFYGHGENVKKEDPKKGDALNEHAVKLEKAGADPKEIHRLNREGDLEGMKKLLEETETEKAAKEELSEDETDYYTKELLSVASDIDTAMEALNKLDWDAKGIDDLEGAKEAIKEAVKRNPEKAKELLESTPGRGEESSSSEMEWSSEEKSYFKRLATDKLRFKPKETKKFLEEMGVVPEEDSDWGIDQAIRAAITKDPNKAWDVYTRLVE